MESMCLAANTVTKTENEKCYTTNEIKKKFKKKRCTIDWLRTSQCFGLSRVVNKSKQLFFHVVLFGKQSAYLFIVKKIETINKHQYLYRFNNVAFLFAIVARRAAKFSEKSTKNKSNNFFLILHLNSLIKYGF